MRALELMGYGFAGAVACLVVAEAVQRIVITTLGAA